VLRWQELIGDGTPTAPAEPARSAPEDLFEPDGGELTDPPTGDEYDSEPSAEGQAAFDLGDAAPAPAPPVELRPPPEAGVALSKFRVQPGSEAAVAPAPGAAADPAARAPKKRPLGRMRLVKRRPGEADARRAWLLRLLTSF
jgi:hypothetical protein